jgi:general secretion pathway protein G
MRTAGFTLIELLIVVAIIGLVAAIAIPNLINAINRARQKRTMADMRGIAEAVEMYQTDVLLFPVHDGVDADLLKVDLRIYVEQFNGSDGWNKPFYYISDGEHYTLTSFGRDGLVDATSSFGPTSEFETDIVFSDGAFVQWPEGRQS